MNTATGGLDLAEERPLQRLAGEDDQTAAPGFRPVAVDSTGSIDEARKSSRSSSRRTSRCRRPRAGLRHGAAGRLL